MVWTNQASGFGHVAFVGRCIKGAQVPCRKQVVGSLQRRVLIVGLSIVTARKVYRGKFSDPEATVGHQGQKTVLLL